MALQHCLHASTMLTARGSRPFSSKEKLILPTFTALGKSDFTYSSSSSFAPSFKERCLKSRIVCKAGEVAQVKEVTDSSWKDVVISSENPVLVEFWAPWCGPCRMIAPVVDELAKEYAGKIVCCKLNTDDCPNIATQYGIRSIPTVLFFKNGEKKESIIGAVPKTTLSATIEKYLEL